MVTGVGSSERAGPARGASFTATERVRLVRRNTALLIVAQGMAWTALPIFATVGPIGAFELSGRERSVGIMVALYGLAEAGAALITGRVMDRLGRRAGLAAGYALLAIGGGGAAWSVSAGWLGGLFASSVPIGAGAGAALLGRAAVADMYPVGRRGRAVGLLLAVGAFGAVGGPAMVEGAQRLTQGSSNGDPLVLPWFLVALLAAIGLGCVLALRPDPRDLSIRDEVSPTVQRMRRSLRKLLAIAPLRTAVVALVVSQAMMVALMSVLPVRIHAHGGVELAVSGTMSLHLLGMFAFSPLIGMFIDRAGRRRGLVAGACLVAAGAVLGSVLPSAVWSVATGLFLVGLGWSASFLGATAIISDVTTATERAGALGFTDCTKDLASAVGGLCGGFVLDATGFAVLGVTAAAMILPVVLLLLPLRELHPDQWTNITKEPASE